MNVKSFPYPWFGPAGGYYVAYFDLDLKPDLSVYSYRLDHVRDGETGEEVRLAQSVLEEITGLFAGDVDREDKQLASDVAEFVGYGDLS